MAFNATALRVEFGTGSYGASPDGAKFFRMASYITDDVAAVVEAAGYFNAAATRLPVGSIIAAVMGMPATVKHKWYVVTVNTGTVVTVALQTATAG
jgi:hypothetical protein